MQTKRVEKLDGIDALGFRLNVEFLFCSVSNAVLQASAFRKGILRGYSERRLKITEDTMLLYTKVRFKKENEGIERFLETDSFQFVKASFQRFQNGR